MKELLEIIRKFEGLRLTPYQCPAGIWTIGYGHTGVDVTQHSPPITLDQAETLLSIDACEFIKQALKLSPILASHPKKLCAIADFCYNLGSGKYKASTLKRRIDIGDWEGAKIEIVKWNKCGGKILKGLKLRRELEALLL